jgi:hypothetical protein
VPQGFRIISGGQTGVDRAALDAAVEMSIPYGGWCPRGGWAEDHPQAPGVLASYPLLRETPLADPAQRTEWNVQDSDATMILVDAGGLPVSPGSVLARELAECYRKPLVVIDLSAADASERALHWLLAQRCKFPGTFTLGIGGPRESEVPGIHDRARAFLRALWVRLLSS